LAADKVKYATRLKSGRWLFNVNVPKDVLTTFGRANYQKALGTSDRREAEKRALALKAKFDKACDLIKEGKPLRYALIAAEIEEGTPLEIAQARIDSLPPQARAALMQGVPLSPGSSEIDALFDNLRLRSRTFGDAFSTMGNIAQLSDPDDREVEKFRFKLKVSDPYFKAINKFREGVAGISPPKLKTLDDMLATWKREEKPKPDRIGVYEVALRRFKEVVGDLSVSEITPQHIAAFKDQIACLPSIAGRRNMYNKTMKEQIKVAEDGNLKRLCGKNVAKHISVIKTLLEVAKKNACVTQNVADNIKVSLPKKGSDDDDEGKRGFTADELNRYFRAIAAKYNSDDDIYWFPLIGAYSGLRREEIGQIDLEDICYESDIWYFNINRLNGKQLKNDHSKRMLPIHHAIIEAGFLNHVERSTQAGPGKVFKSLKLRENRKKYTATLGQMLAYILRNDAGVTDPNVKPCHGLRHMFASACRDVDMSANTMQALLGHASDNPVTGKYGRRAVIETLNNALQKVQHIGVDVSNLTRKPT
jgi:integrase